MTTIQQKFEVTKELYDEIIDMGKNGYINLNSAQSVLSYIEGKMAGYELFSNVMSKANKKSFNPKK